MYYLITYHGFFLTLLEKRITNRKTKAPSIKKHLMQVLNPKIAAADYYTQPKKKRVTAILRKNQKIRSRYR